MKLNESRRKGDGDLWWREGGRRVWTPDIIKESKKKKVPKNIKQHNSFNTDNKS